MFWFFWFLMVLIRKQNLWLWNQYPTGYRFKLQLNLRSDLDPSSKRDQTLNPLQTYYFHAVFFCEWKVPGELCVIMKFSLSEMTRPPNAVSTDTGFMSINIQSGMKLSFGCYEFFIPGFILGPLSSSSPSLSLLEAQNQSSEPNSLARTTSMKSKFVLQFFLPLYFL